MTSEKYTSSGGNSIFKIVSLSLIILSNENAIHKVALWRFKAYRFRDAPTVYHSTTLRSAHTLFMCFVLIWEQAATCATYTINWLVFIIEMKSVYSAVRTGSLNKAVCTSSLNPTGHVMHHQFNIQQLYVLPTLYLCVLYLSENKQRLVPLTP